MKTFGLIHNGSRQGAQRTSGFMITVPAELSRVIPEGTRFVPELVEEGILYRRTESVLGPELPGWTV